ncbi:MAG TPA: tetratricopeptide repeat protein [Thermoanaerobaculia bacterium]|nr:tetratricopeptide repeat protein [Thermoanaerobaculia bacterium]
MNRLRAVSIAVLCIAASIGIANASWYDDYDDGIKAARAGNWSVVIDKMTRAIAGNANENNRARTYGAIFINYHPYYYRGVAYLNTGKYQQAITDFEKTSGPGEFDMGPLGTLIGDAKRKLDEVNRPPVPVPQPQPPVPVPVPVPVPPSGPVIDPVLRSQAQAAVNEARAALERARQRGATRATQYNSASSEFTAANTRQATARTNQDLREAIAKAENAVFLANSAQAPAPPPVQPPGGPDIPVWSNRVRQALESYFQGEFDAATDAFDQLTRERDLRGNAWIWAFLGASQYSQYAFNTDESYRAAANRAFQEARRLGFGRNGLPEKYFSRRIRDAFRNPSG